MADSAVLREYLVALGYKVDAGGQRKFNAALGSSDKMAGALNKTLLSVAASTVAAVATFSVQMEKLYYASKRTSGTVGNLQALEYGVGQIGLSGEKIRSTVIGVAQAIRSNPGLQGLLESLGVRVTGRDKADVMTDLVTQLRRMPAYVAERYANLFGIDPDTLFMLTQGLDTLKKAQQVRKDMAKDAGLDTEQAAEAAKEYANQVRELTERLGMLKDVYAIQMLPYFKEFTSILNENVAALTRWLSKSGSLGGGLYDAIHGDPLADPSKKKDKPKNFWDWLTTPQSVKDMKPIEFKGGSAPIDTATAARSMIPDWMRAPNKRGAAHTGAADSGAGGGRGFVNPGMPASPVAAPGPLTPAASTAEMFARLEEQYALPPGLLDRVWAKESLRGNPKYMLSPKGAKGHFGFMDPTAAQYGLKDPNDLGASAKAAAQMWSERIKARGGDVRMAAADYNWGQGRVDKLGVGKAPAETRDYMDSVAGPAQITQSNSIVLHGVSDPQKAASLVGDQLEINNADLVRNLTPRVR